MLKNRFFVMSINNKKIMEYAKFCSVAKNKTLSKLTYFKYYNAIQNITLAWHIYSTTKSLFLFFFCIGNFKYTYKKCSSFKCFVWKILKWILLIPIALKVLLWIPIFSNLRMLLSSFYDCLKLFCYVFFILKKKIKKSLCDVNIQRFHFSWYLIKKICFKKLKYI